jgi:hypothetical protein
MYVTAYYISPRSKVNHYIAVTMSTTETTVPTTSTKRDASSLDDQKHFWELIKDFKEVFLLSRGADGNEHGRPMHIVSVCSFCVPIDCCCTCCCGVVHYCG